MTALPDLKGAAGRQNTIRYPREYFAAPVEFAWRISAISGMSLMEAMSSYTALQEELTGALFQDSANEACWQRFLLLSAAKPPQEIAAIAYALYLEQPYAQFDPTWAPRGATRFGALGVDTGPYNLDRNQVKLHFLPTRQAGSDLASSRVAQRKDDMRRLLMFVKATYPHIQAITSYTWLQHLPSYRALFPQAFLDRLTAMPDKFLGVWGQFVRWDGSAHRQRYVAFLQRLQEANTLDQAIDAFPLKVLGATGPLQEFYDLYAVR